ncbi:hypothetical protein TNIN_315141 [Trichonephila inaurata madagascariensis]|uniref:Uncharacterized protein n=1 Tax=Trichonephila inaurata madagascariensis TaxID=2747483 RepID=A0A8X6XDI5_9ARAC|nr:hypothetical protein TNIN_136031 [Trichonephila inaurata madagascariensis]GFY59313.1 hypothetical protein TNIN_315141 [Trichonephila inaurata madagascariensis]
MPNERIRSDDVRRIWSLSARSFLHSPTGHERSKVDALLASLPLKATRTPSLGLAMFGAPISQEKSQANQHSKIIYEFTSSDRTSHAILPPFTHVESHNPTPPRPASTPPMDKDSIMDLTLPPSTNTSRPKTPQDTHCRRPRN